MIALHAAILKKDGKKEFVVLPYEEFVVLQELLSDLEDLRDLRAAKQESNGEPTVSLEDIKLEFGL